MRFVQLILFLLMNFVPLSAQVGEGPIINEFLSNPAGLLESEWVEIYNSGDIAIDLQDYRLGDELGWCDISDTALIVEAGEYFILAQDPDRFVEYYYDFDGRVAAPTGWQILNNTDDVIKLGDKADNVIDSFYYDDVWDDNRSWERFVDATGITYWGGSYDPSGSSPGRANSYIYPPPDGIELTVTPDPFSPDGDGYQDEAVVTYDMPEGGEFDLLIYDISGRRVKVIFENVEAIPGEYSWDGCDDGGRRVSIGIYILFARWEGDEILETKKTIVVAR